MKIAITGASGLIGTRLTTALRVSGHEVVRLVRRPPTEPGDVQWDPASGHLDPADLEGVEAAVNLAGPGIGDHRWTEEYKKQVKDARVDATALLATTLARLDPLPKVLLSGSAIGFYGNTGDATIDERSPAGSDFLAEVAVAWEQAAEPAAQAGIRVALLRTGIVLSSARGALAQQLPLYKFGLGGPLGSGRQYQSWIELDDAVAAIVFLLTADVSGPVNLTGPRPVRQKEFARALGHALHRPALLPAPPVALRLVLGEFASVGVLAGQRVMPKALQDSGFRFSYPTIDTAIAAALTDS